MDGLNPDSNGEPRDEMIGLFSAVRKDYGPAGIRVELGHVGVLPMWEENNRNDLAAGREKTPVIRPILIDREIPKLQARLDEFNKPGSALTEDQKREFIAVTSRLKLLTDRREQILARVGSEFVQAPPAMPAKP